MRSEPDPRRCPLCGGPNGCAVEAGSEAATCWCMDVDIPAAVLERIPDAAQDRACVCTACARSGAASPSTARPLRTLAR